MVANRITIRLSAKDIATLDKLRGAVDRSTFLRTLIRRASPKRAIKPTHEEALGYLAQHAEHDARAAIALEQRLCQDADLERLRALATDPAPGEADPATR